MGFFSELKYMITDTHAYTKLEMLAWDVKDKVKDDIQKVKDNPGKTAAKVAASVAVNTIMPGGTVTKKAVKHLTKATIRRAIDKEL